MPSYSTFFFSSLFRVLKGFFHLSISVGCASRTVAFLSPSRQLYQFKQLLLKISWSWRNLCHVDILIFKFCFSVSYNWKFIPEAIYIPRTFCCCCFLLCFPTRCWLLLLSTPVPRSRCNWCRQSCLSARINWPVTKYSTSQHPILHLKGEIWLLLI